ncbi:ankyrin repeat domain-containing protein [Pseudomonas capsici]|uniref:Ankyrin repeat domain-containing protein n=1 Tax=Pseudomonas capsici TaxID=2810614 RepID=A0ABT3BSA0_9PSED|nr:MULTISPECIES: ankyrin repeat domain-containing protein [Pseudomonas]MBN6715289.1 ankyrin repeat domain-containing protein [Pseudomonas capsici]MBN6720314.1 ankyrin repeat domain-containing protein [Pseudomonas capsici]MBN6725190.1 ankyrin repeat domain-containing protein [Pseudomonas capsici]MBX8475274.1 ankyrin repeat domain-containing protein [Pseudomonas cichorii]MBX8613325.1 ankyrin repeat domain-containing protein [Pseudomonas cichorii]
MRTLLYALVLFAAVAQAETPSEQTTNQLRTLFFDASREGNSEMMATFIDAHYDLNIQDEKGYTGLILAAYHGHEQLVTQLIDAGADPCTKDKRGNTALMGAIFKGELSIAKRLVEANCAPDQRNNAGQTASMYAALFQRTEILQALAAKGADLSLRDSMGNDVNNLSRGEFQAPAVQ